MLTHTLVLMLFYATADATVEEPVVATTNANVDANVTDPLNDVTLLADANASHC